MTVSVNMLSMSVATIPWLIFGSKVCLYAEVELLAIKGFQHVAAGSLQQP